MTFKKKKNVKIQRCNVKGVKNHPWSIRLIRVKQKREDKKEGKEEKN